MSEEVKVEEMEIGKLGNQPGPKVILVHTLENIINNFIHIDDPVSGSPKLGESKYR